MMRGRSTDWRWFNSTPRAAQPPAVIGTFSIILSRPSTLCGPIRGPRTNAETEHPRDGRVPVTRAFIADQLPGPGSPANRSGFGKVTLQRADLKVPAQIGADALGSRQGTGKRGEIWHFMQEGSSPQAAAVGQRLRPLRATDY